MIILKTAGILAGLFFLINGIVASFFSNVNTGNILCILFGVIFLTVFTQNEVMCFIKVYKPLSYLKNALIFVCALMIGFSVFFNVYGKTDTVRNTEDAIIVLGAGIRGEKVTNALKYRLDAAIEFLSDNPGAIAVVTGGQGNGETITEAEAMRRYLVDKGIDNSRIIKEEKATSTYENFKFSRQLLDEKFEREYQTVFVTNDFHVFRAEKIGEKAGISPTHIGSKLDWYIVWPCSLRECLAVVKFYLLGY